MKMPTLTEAEKAQILGDNSPGCFSSLLTGAKALLQRAKDRHQAALANWRRDRDSGLNLRPACLRLRAAAETVNRLSRLVREIEKDAL